MKLAWIFCLLLAGKLSCASPAAESVAAADTNSGYMMAFPMEEDTIAEESSPEAVQVLPSEDTPKEEDNPKEQPEPMNVLQAELDAEEESEKPQAPQRSLFKRPKIEELRKILGFPPPEGEKKPLPQEKPKMFQSLFNKPKPKFELSPQPSPLGGIQLNLRREDRLMRPFGLMPSVLQQRSFGFPDLVQAASTLLRRAIVEDERNDENDINSKDDDEPQQDDDDEDDEDDEESLMIVPMPDNKEVRPASPTPLFRRFPLPLPFPRPNAPAVAPVQQRPRLPFPPLTPVAFFLPIAQQIMQNIRQAQPRSAPQPPPLMMMPQQILPTFVPIQHHAPFQHQPQMVPYFTHAPQQSVQMPVLTPLISNQRLLPPRPHRMPLQMPPQRRAPMARVALPPPPPPMQRRAPIHPPMHPILFMMPMAQQQTPIYQKPPTHMLPPFMRHPQEEEKIVFLRHPMEEQEADDDQEVLILVPSDEMEMAQRPPFAPMPRHLPPPSPLQRIRLLRELLMARQSAATSHRPMFLPPPQMAPRPHHPRVVEILQQQLRIYPHQHMLSPHQHQVAASELHPVYVPYPGPQ